MYQLLTPPWMGMSRTWRSDAGRGILAGDVHEPENRLGAVPFLAQRGLGAGQGGPAQFPVSVQPVGIAGQNDDAVFLAGVIQRVRHRDGARTCGGRPGSARGDGWSPPRWPIASSMRATLR